MVIRSLTGDLLGRELVFDFHRERPHRRAVPAFRIDLVGGDGGGERAVLEDLLKKPRRQPLLFGPDGGR